jgi:tetratricopeptide (TPR) repeat protein
MEAERELLTAIALSPSAYTWWDLEEFYRKEGRGSEAIAAMRKSVKLQTDPTSNLMQMGYYALEVGHPDDALEAFDEAVRSASASEKKSTGRGSFAYNVAAGRSEAWSKIGDPKRAIAFQEQAVQLAPEAPQPWLNLAEIYQSQGRSADAERAKARAASLTQNQSR